MTTNGTDTGREGPPPAAPEELFAVLESLGIASTTHHHAPMRTVEDSRALRGELPGGHCKTLFCKDKKGVLWLIVTLEDRRLDLKALARTAGAARLSLARPEVLWRVLGVRPGAVTPFALMNQSAGQVRVVLDQAMLERTPVNYHPLDNTMTTALAPGDLLKFIAHCGHQPQIMDMDSLETQGLPPI